MLHNYTLSRYTLDVYVSLPDGGGVSKGAVEMTQCGELRTTVEGSAGKFEIIGFVTEDSASGTWANELRGTSGDWIAEAERP